MFEGAAIRIGVARLDGRILKPIHALAECSVTANRNCLTAVSLHPPGRKPAKQQAGGSHDMLVVSYNLIVWPESPSPFYTNDPLFRDAVSALARQSGTWVVAGSIGITPAMHSAGDTGGERSQIFNSAVLVSPQGDWVGRYDKVHLVPFGEYLPFPSVI